MAIQRSKTTKAQEVVGTANDSNKTRSKVDSRRKVHASEYSRKLDSLVAEKYEVIEKALAKKPGNAGIGVSADELLRAIGHGEPLTFRQLEALSTYSGWSELDTAWMKRLTYTLRGWELPQRPVLSSHELLDKCKQGSDRIVGRDAECEALDNAWGKDAAGWLACFKWPTEGSEPMSKTPNIIVLQGMGGSGKTLLFAHWATTKVGDLAGRDQAQYLELRFSGLVERGAGGASDLSKASFSLDEVFDCLGYADLITTTATPEAKGELLAEICGQNNVLLVIDGIDPLQDPVTGHLFDGGLKALLSGLARRNQGLCVVTTRRGLPELAAAHPDTVAQWKLSPLSDTAGSELLTNLEVDGTDKEKISLSARHKGHPMVLALLGRYLKRACEGEIHRHEEIPLREADDGGGAKVFPMMKAYQRWLERSNCNVELAILRLIGLFDGVASPDNLAALRHKPAIPGLTDLLIDLTPTAWNNAVQRLVDLRLIEKTTWEPRSLEGFNRDQARKVLEAGDQKNEPKLEKPLLYSFNQERVPPVNRYSIEAHPLVCEFFQEQIEKTAAQEAHARLFRHLRDTAPFWPNDRHGLARLYQAVIHGCRARKHPEACEVFLQRIQRATVGSHAYFSTRQFGLFGADAAAARCFFDHSWQKPVSSLNPESQASLWHIAGNCLRALNRLKDARFVSENAVADISRILTKKRSVTRLKNGESLKTHLAQNARILSELELMMGNMHEALRAGQHAVDMADQLGNSSGEKYLKVRARVIHADALHQNGSVDESRNLFKKAADDEAERSPKDPVLCGIAGFRRCDLLLAEVERQAWRAFLGMSIDKRAGAGGLRRCLETVSDLTLDILNCVHMHKKPPLDFGLNLLTLGRMRLYGRLLRIDIPIPEDKVARWRGEQSPSVTDRTEIESAVDSLRGAEVSYHLPRALLTRAWLNMLEDNSAKAQNDLDQAVELAERGPLVLHRADIYLHRTRLFFRKKKRDYPWKSSDDDLDAAQHVIEECRYQRRQGELDDAHEVICGR